MIIYYFSLIYINIILVQDNYFEEEVTTSNPEDELTMEDQQQEEFINSKDCPIRSPINDISCES